MNSSENIRNALHVVYKTYENVQKLMDYTKIVAAEKTDYVLSSPKFLRRKSDNDTSAWLINDFILLFQNMNDWSEGCSPANHWVFYYPLRNLTYMNFEEHNGYSIAMPKNDNASKTYWGLKKVTTKTIDLFDVTSDNLQELIFGNFDKLREMK